LKRKPGITIIKNCIDLGLAQNRGMIFGIFYPFKYGYVVDFIHIRAGKILNWPFYFNMADAYITMGIFLVLFKEIARTFRSRKPSKAPIFDAIK